MAYRDTEFHYPRYKVLKARHGHQGIYEEMTFLRLLLNHGKQAELSDEEIDEIVRNIDNGEEGKV